MARATRLLPAVLAAGLSLATTACAGTTPTSATRCSIVMTGRI